jgi:hypothetical protein
MEGAVMVLRRKELSGRPLAEGELQRLVDSVDLIVGRLVECPTGKGSAFDDVVGNLLAMSLIYVIGAVNEAVATGKVDVLSEYVDRLTALGFDQLCRGILTLEKETAKC